MRSQRGLTMIELMITVTIGLVVVGAVTYMYVGSKGAYRGNESQARIQEAGRFALDAIGADIRRAGGLGCGTFGSVASLNGVYVNLLPPASTGAPGSAIDPTALTTDLSSQLIAIQGLTTTYPQTAGSTPAAFTNLPTSVTVNGQTVAVPPYYRGDVVQLQIATGAPVQVVADPDLTNKTITIENNTLPYGTTANFSPNDYAVVANCSSATVFQAVSVANTAAIGAFPTPALLSFNTLPLTLPQQVGYGLGSYSTVQHFDQVTYYVGLAQGAAAPALYRYSVAKAAMALLPVEEVADNVEDLDISYGTPSAGGVVFESATAATAAGDWPNVVSVRVSLIAVGDQQGVAPTPQSFKFHGIGTLSWVAPDTRLRQVFTATATLRDRLN
jgi:type IV pilus assembly protein PilW